MQISVSKIREILDLCKPVIPKKPAVKSLSFVFLGAGKAIATDLETMVIISLPEFKDEIPVLVPFAALSEALKYIPSTDTLDITRDGKKVKVTYSGGSASYPTEEPEEFPIPSEDMKVRVEGMLDGDTLIPALLAALPYAATETTRPVLTGVSVTLGGPIEIASSDAYRLSHQILGLTFPVEEKIILPAGAVKMLGHLFAKTPREASPSDNLVKALTAKRQLRVSLIDGKVKVDFGQNYSLLIKLIEGTFPEVRKLIPQTEPILQSQVFAPQLEAALRRVKAVAKDGKDMIKLTFEGNTLLISAEGDDKTFNAKIDTLNTKGDTLTVGMNVKQMLEYFNGNTGIVLITKYDATGGPMSFQYQKTPRVLIMPVSLGVQEKPADDTKEPNSDTVDHVTDTTNNQDETKDVESDTTGDGEGEGEEDEDGEGEPEEATV